MLNAASEVWGYSHSPTGGEIEENWLLDFSVDRCSIFELKGGMSCIGVEVRRPYPPSPPSPPCVTRQWGLHPRGVLCVPQQKSIGPLSGALNALQSRLLCFACCGSWASHRYSLVSQKMSAIFVRSSSTSSHTKYIHMTRVPQQKSIGPLSDAMNASRSPWSAYSDDGLQYTYKATSHRYSPGQRKTTAIFLHTSATSCHTKDIPNPRSTREVNSPALRRSERLAKSLLSKWVAYMYCT